MSASKGEVMALIMGVPDRALISLTVLSGTFFFLRLIPGLLHGE